MSAASASGRSRHPRLAAFAVGFALVVAVTTLALVVVFFLGLPYDGKCPEGSFPATNPAVGGATASPRVTASLTGSRPTLAATPVWSGVERTSRADLGWRLGRRDEISKRWTA